MAEGGNPGAVVVASMADALLLVLQRVDAGEITGVAIATTAKDRSVSFYWFFDAATRAELLGSIALLQHRLCQ